MPLEDTARARLAGRERPGAGVSPRTGRFDRSLLPDSATYFARVGVKLLGRGAWRSARCPFHDDARPSLRVHVPSGAWRCMACGMRGGDVLAFERARTGASFVAAARALGAWR